METDKRKVTASEIMKALAGIVLTFAALYGVYSYVDWRIEKKINSPEFIRKISSNIRPSVVFDSRESIEIDLGAMCGSHLAERPHHTGEVQEQRLIVVVVRDLGLGLVAVVGIFFGMNDDG